MKEIVETVTSKNQAIKHIFIMHKIYLDKLVVRFTRNMAKISSIKLILWIYVAHHAFAKPSGSSDFVNLV